MEGFAAAEVTRAMIGIGGDATHIPRINRFAHARDARSCRLAMNTPNLKAVPVVNFYLFRFAEWARGHIKIAFVDLAT